MNAAERIALDTLPIPAGEAGLVACGVVGDDKGRPRTAWLHDGGLRKEIFGEPFRDIHAACGAKRARACLVDALEELGG